MQRAWIFSALFMLGLLVTMPGQAWSQAPDAPMQQALEDNQQVQQKVQTWSQEKQALVQKILDLQTRKAWLSLQNEQYAAYISQKEAALDRLREEERVAKSLRMQLEPFLVQVVHHLQDQVQKDAPFLPQERADRLQFLKDSLKEYGISLSERLRRVLEALAVEAQYGTSVEVTDRKLDIGKGSKRVQVLRLGRVVLFYVTQDGRQAGIWDETEQSWRALPADMAANVHTTVEIAEGRRAAELVSLPLGSLHQNQDAEGAP